MGGAQREGRGPGSTLDEPEMSREQKGEVRLQLPLGHQVSVILAPPLIKTSRMFALKYFINLPLPSTPEVSFLKVHHLICGLYNQPPNWPPSFLVDLIQFFSYNQSFNSRVGLRWISPSLPNVSEASSLTAKIQPMCLEFSPSTVGPVRCSCSATGVFIGEGQRVYTHRVERR